MQSDLEVFRMRMNELEVVVLPGKDAAFFAILVQRWTPAWAADEFGANAIGAGAAAPGATAAPAAASAGAGGGAPAAAAAPDA